VVGEAWPRAEQAVHLGDLAADVPALARETAAESLAIRRAGGSVVGGMYRLAAGYRENTRAARAEGAARQAIGVARGVSRQADGDVDERERRPETGEQRGELPLDGPGGRWTGGDRQPAAVTAVDAERRHAAQGLDWRTGSQTVNVVPLPTSLATSMRPWCLATMP
jgi:hypothetical protein